MLQLALLLNGSGQDLSALDMAIRAIFVYGLALIYIRLADKRLLGKNAAFDFVLAIILGSVLSRAVTGNSPFFPTVAAGLVLIGIHWLMAAAAFHSDRIGKVIKGSERTLIEDGEIRWHEMRKSHISKRDLLAAMRLNGRVTYIHDVKLARFERNGDISVIVRKDEPRVVQFDVSEGVQRVKIEFE